MKRRTPERAEERGAEVKLSVTVVPVPHMSCGCTLVPLIRKSPPVPVPS